LLTVPHDGIQKCSFRHLHVLTVQKTVRLSEELELTYGSGIKSIRWFNIFLFNILLTLFEYD